MGKGLYNLGDADFEEKEEEEDEEDEEKKPEEICHISQIKQFLQDEGDRYGIEPEIN